MLSDVRLRVAVDQRDRRAPLVILSVSVMLAFAMFIAAQSVASANVAPFTAYGTGLAEGQKVEALIDGKSCGFSKVNADGEWVIVIQQGTCGAKAGAKVTFKLDGKHAEGHLVWSEGGTPDDIALGLKLVVKEGAKSGKFSTTLVKGFNIAMFSGGSIESAVESAPGMKSMWVAVGGKLYGYLVGTPDFVNATFVNKFQGGIPDGTAMLVIIE